VVFFFQTGDSLLKMIFKGDDIVKGKWFKAVYWGGGRLVFCKVKKIYNEHTQGGIGIPRRHFGGGQIVLGGPLKKGRIGEIGGENIYFKGSI